jgi:hypothetical protein
MRKVLFVCLLSIGMIAGCGSVDDPGGDETGATDLVDAEDAVSIEQPEIEESSTKNVPVESAMYGCCADCWDGSDPHWISSTWGHCTSDSQSYCAAHSVSFKHAFWGWCEPGW